MSDIVLIEPCDFRSFPVGGQLTFARQMLAAFGCKLRLVGIGTDDTPVGQWVERTIDGVPYLYFAIYRCRPSARRPTVPARVAVYRGLRRHRRRILSQGAGHAFVQAHEALMAIAGWGWESLCYRFPGVESPLGISRYPWAKALSRAFDARFFRALRQADVILAAADNASIDRMILRARGQIERSRVAQFPTRVDTQIFRPRPIVEARQEAGIPPKATVVVTSGRIHWAKGWQFLLEAFRAFRETRPDSRLYFVGDGQDRSKLEKRAAELGLEGRVQVTGYQQPAGVARYLNAADLFVLGSRKEGWATALVEALACAKPMVSTAVSSAREIVAEGQNGFVVEQDDLAGFSAAMHGALTLGDTEDFSRREARKYALEGLKPDLEALWPYLKDQPRREMETP